MSTQKMLFPIRHCLNGLALYEVEIDDEGPGMSVERKRRLALIKLMGQGVTDFKFADLARGDFFGLDLSCLDFSYANLRGSDMCLSILRHTRFSYADMRRISCHNSHVYKTIGLEAADLRGAATDFMVFGPVGYSGRMGLAYPRNGVVYVQLGCFEGPADYAIELVKSKYGKKNSYVKLLKAAVARVEECMSQYRGDVIF